MANNENLKGHGFHERTAEEQRRIAVMGGKASGEARRQKANFRRTLNLLLTVKIDSPEWTPVLEALGLDSTLESAVNAAMIREALAGNVKAYEAIAKYSGQSCQSDTEVRNIEADTELKQVKARAEKERVAAPGDQEDGVEVINDAPEEAGADIRGSDSKVSADF